MLHARNYVTYYTNTWGTYRRPRQLLMQGKFLENICKYYNVRIFDATLEPVRLFGLVSWDSLRRGKRPRPVVCTTWPRLDNLFDSIHELLCPY